jgi:adenosylcobinamide-GDP ribazoletransferase
MLNPLLIAVQFLTRFPVPLPEAPSHDGVARSLPWYPLVGMLIGIVLWMSAGLLQTLPVAVLAMLVLGIWVMITGALHLDGLADSADAWIGAQGDRERTLAIMKDPYCGPAGVVVLVLLLLGKFVALESLLSSDDWSGLLLAPVIGRAVLPLLFLTTKYVRQQGLGKAFDGMSNRACALSIAASAIFALLLNGFWAVCAVVMVFALLRWLMVARLGGTTGDTAGALVEISELVVLVALLPN